MIIGSAAVSGRCIVCGADRCGCGPDTSHLNPIDLPKDATLMGKLKVYDVVYNGVPTRMKLTEEDAERLGATTGKKAAKKATTKKRTAKNKAAETD